ncbi:MAG: hypothetical protein FJW20_18985 [Acidimicrobiia bacterium]|nr:hypothetical protein [Acidimicrobiia bacterium]
MTLDALEQEIEQYVEERRRRDALLERLKAEKSLFHVIKYLPARWLDTALTNQKLLASDAKGFTWGDAVYVAPLSQPLSTMMYGDVGVVGTVNASRFRLFDATDPRGVDLYQQWITYHPAPYRMLTTTIHADCANHELRNSFRTRFQIDCVCFHPDEPCANYAAVSDLWLALTLWDSSRAVAPGPSSVVANLAWCVIGSDTFERDGLGFRAYLHPLQTGGVSFSREPYANLPAAVLNAYKSGKSVVIAGF